MIKPIIHERVFDMAPKTLIRIPVLGRESPLCAQSQLPVVELAGRRQGARPGVLDGAPSSWLGLTCESYLPACLYCSAFQTHTYAFSQA